MTKKSWVITLLSLTVALGALLAGCSNKEESSGNTSGNQTDGGKKPEVRKDISVSIYDRGNVSPDEGTIENNRWTKWLNEKGPANVKFVAIPRTKPEEKINVLYASGSAPDLLFEFSPKIRDPLYQQKQFMPLNDLIDKYSVGYKKLIKENPALLKAGTKEDGKLYYFGRLNFVSPSRGILIRTDWLKKLGLQMPETTEDLYKVAKVFAEQDPDGNGKRDTYGLALSGDTGYNLRQAFGVTTRWVVKNGELVIDWDRSVDFHNFAKRIYDEGLIDRDFPTDGNGAKAKQDFINGKLGIYGFLSGDPVNIMLSVVDPMKKNAPGGEVQFLPYPKSKAGAFIPTLQNPIQMTAAISASAKNPEAVMKYVDFLLEDSTSKSLQYGVEGTHYKTENGCSEVIDAVKQKKEVTDLTADLRMLDNGGLRFSKCDMPLIKYKSDPRKQEFQDANDAFRSTYLTYDRDYAELTVSEHMPSLPNDLATIEQNAGNAGNDIWLKSIVSGGKYSVEQAQKDAQNEWNKAGGKQVEEWYKNWYKSDKDKAFLFKDMLEVTKKMDETYKKIRQELK
ncbi:MAG: family 1 extracellular solute-binding protein [Paenibacillus sp.]|jgi:putative aldouronate transport system substrate-binding protein|nr:family 1 extracellular solute-binding protein [Paenibacillus sp.]